MKTKYFVLIIFIAGICFSSCKKETMLLNKYYGVWEIQKYEYYTQDIASGNFSLTTTQTLSDDTASSYFLLYNYQQGSDEKQNLCLYKFHTITSGLATALGNSGACYWYMTTKDQIIMWDAGVPEIIVTVSERKANEMQYSFTGATYKEIYYLKRADV
jgi:hypothetical protein